MTIFPRIDSEPRGKTAAPRKYLGVTISRDDIWADDEPTVILPRETMAELRAADDYASRHLDHAARAHGAESCRPELDLAVTAEYPVYREEA